MERNTDADADDATFEGILAEYLDARDRNAPLSRAELLARHPRFANRLAEFFQSDDEVDRVARNWRDAADQTETLPTPIPGYEITDILGRGGMGIVYRARQIELDRMVAMKMIRPGLLADEESVSRFRIEATATARLQHPHIVPIHEVGQHGGQHFYVMDLVEGGSLADTVRVGPLDSPAAARFAREIAQTIAYSHERGVIHRDLKPSNILIDRSGSVRITDFGLAKQADRESSLTATGVVLGTPSYMSPEQARGAPSEIGPASDLYSIGAILYELVTGRPPFRGASAQETVQLVLHAEPPAPRLLNPAVPRDLETICLKCLEKEPPRRYSSAQALADDLGRFIEHRPIMARPLSHTAILWRWCRRSPATASLLALSAGMLVLVAILSSAYSLRLSSLLADLSIANSTAEVSRQQAVEHQHVAERERDVAQSISYVIQTRQALADWEASDIAEAKRLLDVQVPIGGGADRRGWEWYFVDRLCGQAGTVLSHPNAVKGIAWSPDGTRLACALSNGEVHLWNASTGKELSTIPVAKSSVTCIDWSHRGERFATGDLDWKVKVFSVTTGKVERTYAGAWGPVHSVAWSRDDDILAAGTEKNILLWDVPSGKVVRSLKGHKGRVTALEWSPNSDRLASAAWSDGGCVWDAKTGQVLTSMPWLQQKGMAQDLSWSPDGSRIAYATWGGQVFVADAQSGDVILTTSTASRSSIQSIDWKPDGQTLVTVGYDRLVREWDAQSGEEIRTLRGHSDWGQAIAWSPDGKRLASGGKDGDVRIWKGGDPFGPVVSTASRAVYALKWSPNGELLASADDKRIYVQSNDRRWDWPAHDGYIYDLAWNPDGTKLASASADKTIRLWDPRTGNRLGEWTGHREMASSIDWRTDGKLVASSDFEGHVRIWDAASGSVLASFDAPSPRGLSLPGDPQPMTGLEWRPDGRRLAVASGKTLTLWDPDTQKVVGEPLPMDDIVWAITWSSDGKRLAVGGRQHQVEVWDPEHRERLAVLRGHGDRVEALAWHPSENRLASGGWDKSIRIWNLDVGELALTLRAHRSWVSSLSWSQDGQRLASGGWDATVRLWDAGVSAAQTPR